LRTELTPLQKRVAQLETDNARLTTDNLALKGAATAPLAQVKPTRRTSRSEAPSPFAAFFGAGKGGTNATGGAWGQLMKAGIQQQIEGKVSALKLRLKLTEAQEAAIRAQFQTQFDRAGEMATRMFQGKVSKDEMQKVAGDEKSTEAAIRELLTPEQLAEYDKYQQEERQTQAARVANLELLQMQSALQLTTEQQEQVYNILYDQILKGIATANRYEGVVIDNTQRTDALRGVLTAEQFQAYEKQQAARQQMVHSWMQAFGGSTNSAEPVSVQIEVAP
jgi:hypothetical protein